MSKWEEDRAGIAAWRSRGFETRIAYCLANAGIATEQQVRAASDQHLLSLPNFGKTSLAKLRALYPADHPKPNWPAIYLAQALEDCGVVISWATAADVLAQMHRKLGEHQRDQRDSSK
jgi:hypothetical protein